MIQNNRLRIVKAVLEGYQPPQPFSVYIKDVFRRNKQYGSRDRKMISEYCHCFFRMGKSVPLEEVELRILLGYFMANQLIQDDLFTFLAGELKTDMLNATSIALPPAEKMNLIAKYISPENIFPCMEQVSETIDRQDLLLGCFRRSYLWLRTKPGTAAEIKEYLDKLGKEYTTHPALPDAIGFQQSFDVTTLPEKMQNNISVQDISSQLAGQNFQAQPTEKWWDCCAASGGKSILLKSVEPKVDLYVSDNRESIMKSLAERFKKNRITPYQFSVMDLQQPLSSKLEFTHSQTNKKSYIESFDAIILDAPCTGSGTWKRSPERLIQVNQEEILSYQRKQLEIASNVVPFLKPGGQLIYMTCSVYAAENGDVVNELQKQHGLQMQSLNLYNESERGGDCLFQAVMVKG